MSRSPRGFLCIVCDQVIAGVGDGRNCAGCGKPVHFHCLALGENRAEGGCSVCGAERTKQVQSSSTASQKAASPKHAAPQEVAAAEKPPIAVSRVCPQCGGAEYTTRTPEAVIAFVNDRVCNACGTRYTPPTPSWAGVVFIVIGLTLVILVAWSIIRRGAAFAAGDPGQVMGIPTMIFEVFLGVLGVASLRKGVKVIRPDAG